MAMGIRGGHMVLFEWDDSYSVDVAEIDEQHKKLVGMINKLHDALEQKKDETVVDDILNDLIDYADEHFSVEEKYFDKFSYEETVPHKKQHRQFIERVGNLKRGHRAGGETLSQDVLQFMKDWLIGHINGSDKKYTQCFKDNGLE